MAYPADTNEALGASLPKVALLTHDEPLGATTLFDGKLLQSHSSYEVKVEPPAASADFIERWLNTDIVWCERRDSFAEDWNKPGGALSDSAFDGRTPAELIAFRDALTTQVRRFGSTVSSKNPNGLSWHPAVSAIGIAVWVDGATKPLPPIVFRMERSVYDAAARVLIPGAKRRVTITVMAAAANAAATTATPGPDVDPDHRLSIEIARGSFVRVFSLVDARHFDVNDPDTMRSSDCRFYSGIELVPSEQDWVPVFDGKDGAPPFRAFGPSELWFEAAPSWKDFAADDFALEVVAPTRLLKSSPEPLASGLMALESDSQMQASWVKSLFVQRHEWHWTGYPVRIPALSKSALADWLVSFAGVESYREGFEAPLQTGFGAGEWKYGPAAAGSSVVHRRLCRPAPGPRAMPRSPRVRSSASGRGSTTASSVPDRSRLRRRSMPLEPSSPASHRPTSTSACPRRRYAGRSR